MLGHTLRPGFPRSKEENQHPNPMGLFFLHTHTHTHTYFLFKTIGREIYRIFPVPVGAARLIKMGLKEEKLDKKKQAIYQEKYSLTEDQAYKEEAPP